MNPTHALYGYPPRDLIEIPSDARQCSPLVPGSARMMDIPSQSLLRAVVYAPPGTIERRYVLARMLAALGVGAPLTALAPNDKGGNRIAAELRGFGCEVAEHSKQHHRIVTTTRPATLEGIDEAIAAGGLQTHTAHGLWTHPGVFSWDRIDTGSALLLAHLPPLAGAGADFGCGIGVLSRTVLTSPNVTTLTLLDIDRRAIAAAQKNIADARANFIWGDARTTTLPALDFIVMNPPFHDEGIEDKTLGQRFIECAATALKPGGALWLVANTHLPYEALLTKLYSRVQPIAEADGFKIFRGEK